MLPAGKPRCGPHLVTGWSSFGAWFDGRQCMCPRFPCPQASINNSFSMFRMLSHDCKCTSAGPGATYVNHRESVQLHKCAHKDCTAGVLETLRSCPRLGVRRGGQVDELRKQTHAVVINTAFLPGTSWDQGPDSIMRPPLSANS